MFAGSNKYYTAVCAVMLLIAFVKCYQTTHDLHWACDYDFDRDMSFIHGNQDGKFGKDPNYLGEYLWYNPLVFSIETIIVKISGLPANVVVTRAGVYLNILAPIAFLCMLLVFFDKKIALGGMVAFLFLSAGKIPGWCGATYSPWLYPVCFVQFIFYLNLIFFYKAYSSGSHKWFLILGIGLGISFLGHLAPTLIVLLIVACIMGTAFIRALLKKDWAVISRIVLQVAPCATCFLVVAFPLLYFIAGKYHLHYVNRFPFELQDNLTNIFYPGGIIKRNFSLSFVVSLVGLWWFYKFYPKPLIRQIILNWFFISCFLYVYSCLIPVISRKYHIFLPGSVPAFHYFFYIKSVQSVFFPFGLIFLLKELWGWFYNTLGKPRQILLKIRNHAGLFTIGIMIIAIMDLPFYLKRDDFTIYRDLAIKKASDTNRVNVYNYITQNIPSGQVILCDQANSLFPVMATGRKMVAVVTTFSNPFTSYVTRENDRTDMLNYLLIGAPATAAPLFERYHVNYVLITASDAAILKRRNQLPFNTVYQNSGYVILSVNGNNISLIKAILPPV